MKRNFALAVALAIFCNGFLVVRVLADPEPTTVIDSRLRSIEAARVAADKERAALIVVVQKLMQTQERAVAVDSSVANALQRSNAAEAGVAAARQTAATADGTAQAKSDAGIAQDQASEARRERREDAERASASRRWDLLIALGGTLLSTIAIIVLQIVRESGRRFDIKAMRGEVDAIKVTGTKTYHLVNSGHLKLQRDHLATLTDLLAIQTAGGKSEQALSTIGQMSVLESEIKLLEAEALERKA